MSRKACHAGSWYTEQGPRLNEELTQWLDNVPEKAEDVPIPVPGARAIIAPHAGYMWSGQAAAFAYKSINPDFVKRVFIFGPSHHFNLTKCALSQCTQYETPLGNLKLDTEMSRDVEEEEHSIEMHLPYTYKILESKVDSIKIVPIMVGSLNSTKETFYGELFAPYLADPSNLFIISTDFCHWGPRFSYTYYSASPGNSTYLSRVSNKTLPIPIYKSIEKLDREGMDFIENIDHKGYISYLSKTKNTICGRHPVGILLSAIETLQKSYDIEQPRIKFIHYSQSNQC
ncbi:11595_t:CDS:2 [Funneliformis geosporum]|nr:11595_t:CDS:2 [Funneliformis geosporum]